MATRFAFLALVGACGLLLTFYPTLVSGFAQMQPDVGDVLLNNLFLEHTYRWAFDSHYAYSFWSPGFFYPTPYTFTYSETLIGTAPLYWLLRGVGCSELLACQLWTIITCALNFISLAIVLRWSGVNTLLTAAGAYVFAFGLIRVDHLTHLQLMPQYFSPFAIWYAWAILREPSARRWAMLVLLSTAQVFASLHLGWFLAFGLLIFACWGLSVEAGSWARVRTFVRQRPVATIAPVLVAALIVGAYARNFYRGAPTPRTYWEATVYCPRPDGWFVAASGSLWTDHLTPQPPSNYPEKMLFQGFAVYSVFVTAGWYAYRRRFPNRGLVVAGVGTAIVLMLSVTRWGGEVSLWFLVYEILPGANAFRAVSRMAFAAYLFGLIGGLVGVQAIVTERVSRPGLRAAVAGLIAAAMIIEQLRPFPEHFDKQAEFSDRARSLVPQMRGVDVAYVVDDESMLEYAHQITAMWAGSWANVPVMNGFSGIVPPGYPGLHDRPTVEDLVRALGPNWRGKLAVIEWGPPIRRRVYQVEPGNEPSRRLSLTE